MRNGRITHSITTDKTTNTIYENRTLKDYFANQQHMIDYFQQHTELTNGTGTPRTLLQRFKEIAFKELPYDNYYTNQLKTNLIYPGRVNILPLFDIQNLPLVYKVDSKGHFTKLRQSPTYKHYLMSVPSNIVRNKPTLKYLKYSGFATFESYETSSIYIKSILQPHAVLPTHTIKYLIDNNFITKVKLDMIMYNEESKDLHIHDHEEACKEVRLNELTKQEQKAIYTRIFGSLKPSIGIRDPNLYVRINPSFMDSTAQDHYYAQENFITDDDGIVLNGTDGTMEKLEQTAETQEQTAETQEQPQRSYTYAWVEVIYYA